MRTHRPVAGFTLIELLIAVVVLGVMMMLLAPVLSSFITANANSYAEQAATDNQRIADALLAVARNEGVGTLSAPYSGGGYSNTIYNSAATTAVAVALQQALAETGIAPRAVNDDGTTARNVRVFQRITGLTQSTPMYFRSGPLVTLTYDYGVVYLTACSLDSGSCGSGVPGASPALTSGNRNTWATVRPDLAPRFVSTLPVQTSMLTTTTRRLDRVRDALLSYYRGRQLTASATDTTNWFPGSGLGGRAPSSNMGCRDGWYQLDTANVLTLVGLSPNEFGLTSWGGRVEYCRDYDPTTSKAENAPPHAAALRIRASVSTGAAPDPSVLANNVILTL
ncbi:type II secretion system protein [Xanthomonas arboricola]|uniref:type II secretion system protein n=1 Tax=Xanthomonas arboricola TaxID=56448 RepID=UPI000A74A849|nr:type II secretion system protein [Xanthomonas arboricola]